MFFSPLLCILKTRTCDAFDFDLCGNSSNLIKNSLFSVGSLASGSYSQTYPNSSENLAN